MEVLPVDSIELEANAHPGEDDKSTLSGNTGCQKKCCNNTTRQKNQNLKTDLGCKKNQIPQRGKR